MFLLGINVNVGNNHSVGLGINRPTMRKMTTVVVKDQGDVFWICSKRQPDLFVDCTLNGKPVTFVKHSGGIARTIQILDREKNKTDQFSRGMQGVVTRTWGSETVWRGIQS